MASNLQRRYDVVISADKIGRASDGRSRVTISKGNIRDKSISYNVQLNFALGAKD